MEIQTARLWVKMPQLHQLMTALPHNDGVLKVFSSIFKSPLNRKLGSVARFENMPPVWAPQLQDSQLFYYRPHLPYETHLIILSWKSQWAWNSVFKDRTIYHIYFIYFTFTQSMFLDWELFPFFHISLFYQAGYKQVLGYRWRPPL